MLRSGAGRDGYKAAFARVLGVSSEGAVAAVAGRDGRRRTGRSRRRPSWRRPIARPLIADTTGRGGLNVSPELSPDGSKIAFFSARDLFSIDLYVADATTGKILRKITDTATSPHIESIGFIDSAGAWSRDSAPLRVRRASSGGKRRAVHSSMRVNGDKERKIKIKEVDEILNPTWSPDGNQIAFSALAGGLSDLFIYDLAASALQRVTTDAFSELHPAWSPDGRIDRVQHRPVHQQPARPGRRPDQAGGAGRRHRQHPRARRVRRREEHQSAVDARQPRRLLRLGPPGDLQRLPHGRGWRRADRRSPTC